MNDDTRPFEPVEQTPTTPPAPEARSSHLRTAVILAVGLLLGLAVTVVFFAVADLGNRAEPMTLSEATATTEQEQTEVEPSETQQAASTSSEEDEARTRSSDTRDRADEEPSEPVHEDPPPAQYIHPLEGTVWDVMVLGDGAGNMYDIHPSYSHQIEFRDGRVYSRGAVNGGSAEYSISGDKYGWGSDLSCGTITTTMMLGPSEAMRQESLINSALENAAYYELFENVLFIRDASGNDLLFLDVVPGG